LSGIFSSLKKIRQHKYDIIIDAYAKNFSYLLTLFSGAKKKISFKKGYNFFIYTDLVKRIIPARTDRGYAVKNRLILLDPLTDSKLLDTSVKPQIYLTSEEIQTAKFKIEQEDINSKFIFMVSAIGSNHEKTYPLKYMAEFLDYIAQAIDVSFFFNYTNSQSDQAKELYNLCADSTKECIYLDMYENNLRDFFALTYHCDALIGNEGGAINIAKALNKPTFAIYSPTTQRSSWSIYEETPANTSVHLLDYKPELYENKKFSEVRRINDEYFLIFKPTTFKKDLDKFLSTFN